MTWRAIGVARANWKRGASVLERPSSPMARRATASRRASDVGPGAFKLLFLGLMGSGMPVAIAMAGVVARST